MPDRDKPSVLRDHLVSVAESRETTTYGDVANVLDDIPVNVGRYVYEVCRRCVQRGEPMLGALIVSKKSGKPGNGFYENAHEFGRTQKPPEDMSEEVKEEFWLNEVERVYEELG
ncbi:MAG: hypothetical protein ABEK59_01610 [Halobacteria archaeon]